MSTAQENVTNVFRHSVDFDGSYVPGGQVSTYTVPAGKFAVINIWWIRFQNKSNLKINGIEIAAAPGAITVGFPTTTTYNGNFRYPERVPEDQQSSLTGTIGDAFALFDKGILLSENDTFTVEKKDEIGSGGVGEARLQATIMEFNKP